MCEEEIGPTPEWEGLFRQLSDLSKPVRIPGHFGRLNPGMPGRIHRNSQVLLELETNERAERRIERLLKRSGLPEGKTLATFNQKLMPMKVRRQIPLLVEGGFVDRARTCWRLDFPDVASRTCWLPLLGNW